MKQRTAIERERLLAVLDRLESAWGMERNPRDRSFGSPLDGLVATLLSQNTNDRNSERAFYEMKRRWPTWTQVMDAGLESLVDAIRPAGLGPTKATRIREILLQVRSDFGSYDLDSLKRRDPAEVRAYLESLPGVGPKTAACVLVFELDIPAFPVDTHVMRIARRLGWFTERQGPAEIQEELERSVPKERQGGGHLNFILHGRNTCHSRKPDCSGCVLADLCPSYEAKGFRKP